MLTTRACSDLSDQLLVRGPKSFTVTVVVLSVMKAMVRSLHLHECTPTCFWFMSHCQTGLQSESRRLTLHMAQQLLSYRHRGNCSCAHHGCRVICELSAQQSAGCHLCWSTSPSWPFDDLNYILLHSFCSLAISLWPKNVLIKL